VAKGLWHTRSPKSPEQESINQSSFTPGCARRRPRTLRGYSMDPSSSGFVRLDDERDKLPPPPRGPWHPSPTSPRTADPGEDNSNYRPVLGIVSLRASVFQAQGSTFQLDPASYPLTPSQPFFASHVPWADRQRDSQAQGASGALEPGNQARGGAAREGRQPGGLL
jgi:hypothetical protein